MCSTYRVLIWGTSLKNRDGLKIWRFMLMAATYGKNIPDQAVTAIIRLMKADILVQALSLVFSFRQRLQTGDFENK